MLHFARASATLPTGRLGRRPTGRTTADYVQAEHADELIAAIEARLAGRPAAVWEAEFVSAGLPASVVRTLAEIIAEPHVGQRGIVSEVDVPELARKTTVVGAGFRFEHDPPRFQGPVPRLGDTPMRC
ncbi:MAG TPA: CoA transferase [Chloroflexota bacterium]|nr:CoA transferase [Chloroflexota bacterium]